MKCHSLGRYLTTQSPPPNFTEDLIGVEEASKVAESRVLKAPVPIYNAIQSLTACRITPCGLGRDKRQEGTRVISNPDWKAAVERVIDD